MKFKTILFVWLLAASTHVFAIADVHTAVQAATDDLLARLLEVKPLYKSDPDEFYAAVDSTLGPFIDFKGFAKGVMAKYFRRATEVQKQQFAIAFRKGLIETYAKALVAFDSQKVIVLKPTTSPKRPDRASITLQIHSKSGPVYEVAYTLVVINDDWKLRNLSINGINVGLQFRSQFAESMRKHKNNIDDVIAFWSIDV